MAVAAGTSATVALDGVTRGDLIFPRDGLLRSAVRLTTESLLRRPGGPDSSLPADGPVFRRAGDHKRIFTGNLPGTYENAGRVVYKRDDLTAERGELRADR